MAKEEEGRKGGSYVQRRMKLDSLGSLLSWKVRVCDGMEVFPRSRAKSHVANERGRRISA